MRGVTSSVTECFLIINMAFMLASLLKSIAELQFLIKDFMRRLKIFTVLVSFFPNLECGDSLCRHYTVSVMLFAVVFLFSIYLLAYPKP